MLGEIAGCLTDSTESIVRLTGEMRGHLSRVGAVVGQVQQTLDALGALHICGRIEVAGVRDSAGFRVLLDDVKVQLDEGAEQVASLREAAERCNNDAYDVEELRRHASTVQGTLIAA